MIFRLSGLIQYHNWLILLVSDITAAEKRRHLECSHNGGAFKGFIGFASDERDLSSTGKKKIIIIALSVNQKKPSTRSSYFPEFVQQEAVHKEAG